MLVPEKKATQCTKHADILLYYALKQAKQLLILQYVFWPTLIPCISVTKNFSPNLFAYFVVNPCISETENFFAHFVVNLQLNLVDITLHNINRAERKVRRKCFEEENVYFRGVFCTSNSKNKNCLRFLENTLLISQKLLLPPNSFWTECCPSSEIQNVLCSSFKLTHCGMKRKFSIKRPFKKPIRNW